MGADEMQGQAVPVLQKIFLFLLLTKRVFVVKNLAFLHPLPFESSGKQLNSTTTLYASIHQKNSTNMKQLALFQMTSEAQSLAIAGQAKLEKQSNISSNITTCNAARDEVARASEDAENCHLLLQWRNIKSQYPDAVLLWCSLSVLSVFSQWNAREKGFAFARRKRTIRRLKNRRKCNKKY